MIGFEAKTMERKIHSFMAVLFTCLLRKCSPVLMSKPLDIRCQCLVFFCSPSPLLQSHLVTGSFPHVFLLVLVDQISRQNSWPESLPLYSEDSMQALINVEYNWRKRPGVSTNIGSFQEGKTNIFLTSVLWMPNNQLVLLLKYGTRVGTFSQN